MLDHFASEKSNESPKERLYFFIEEEGENLTPDQSGMHRFAATATVIGSGQTSHRRGLTSAGEIPLGCH